MWEPCPPHPGGCSTLGNRQPGDGRFLLVKASSPVKWGEGEKQVVYSGATSPVLSSRCRNRKTEECFGCSFTNAFPRTGNSLALQQLPQPPPPPWSRGCRLAPDRHSKTWLPRQSGVRSQRSSPFPHVPKAGQGIQGPRALGEINCLLALWKREYPCMSLSEEGSAPHNSL